MARIPDLAGNVGPYVFTAAATALRTWWSATPGVIRETLQDLAVNAGRRAIRNKFQRLAKRYIGINRAANSFNRFYPMRTRRYRRFKRTRRGRRLRRRYGRRYRRRSRRYLRRGRRSRVRRRIFQGVTKAKGRRIRFARWVGDVQSLYPENLTCKLGNMIFLQPTMKSGVSNCGMEHSFAWNTWETGGTVPNSIGKWIGQDTLGRIYRRYRIINAMTKFKWVPSGISAIQTDAAAVPAGKYRGDVYFYAVCTDTATSPVTGVASTFSGTPIGNALVMRNIMAIPGIRIKRARWSEVPQACTMTFGQNMPMSTRIAKNPDYADDLGPFAGTIQLTLPATLTYNDPATVLWVHFGFFIPTAVTFNPSVNWDDYPSYKLEMRDLTLCRWSGIDPALSTVL